MTAYRCAAGATHNETLHVFDVTYNKELRMDFKLLKLKIFNKDVKEFHSQIGWYFSDPLLPNVQSYHRIAELEMSTEFKQYFPDLHKLLVNARILDINFELFRWRLYTWNISGNLMCGWLVRRLDDYSSIGSLSKEHVVLLNSLGTIECTYNRPKGFPVGLSDSFFSPGQNLKYLIDNNHVEIQESLLQQIDISKFICIDTDKTHFYHSENMNMLILSNKNGKQRQINEMSNAPSHITSSSKMKFNVFVNKMAKDWSEHVGLKVGNKA